jgi:hypothetical protein
MQLVPSNTTSPDLIHMLKQNAIASNFCQTNYHPKQQSTQLRIIVPIALSLHFLDTTHHFSFAPTGIILASFFE